MKITIAANYTNYYQFENLEEYTIITIKSST